jgi:hypothetical protein
MARERARRADDRRRRDRQVLEREVLQPHGARARPAGRERDLDRAELAHARRRRPGPMRTRSRCSRIRTAPVGGQREASVRCHHTFRPLGSASFSSSVFAGTVPRTSKRIAQVSAARATSASARRRTRRRRGSRSRAAGAPARAGLAGDVERRQTRRDGEPGEGSAKSSSAASGMRSLVGESQFRYNPRNGRAPGPPAMTNAPKRDHLARDTWRQFVGAVTAFVRSDVGGRASRCSGRSRRSCSRSAVSTSSTATSPATS